MNKYESNLGQRLITYNLPKLSQTIRVIPYCQTNFYLVQALHSITQPQKQNRHWIASWCQSIKIIILSMDNEFINAPLLVSKSTPYIDPKDQLIRTLELKNSKLKSELIKIQRSIEEKFSIEEDDGPKKRQSIFNWQQNFDVLKKQLANAYKRIEMYDYQISKLENANNSNTSSVTAKSSQIEAVIKEKKAMAEKLKSQLAKQQKILQQNTKKLQKNSKGDQNELYMRKLGQQSKFFKQKVRYLEGKDAIKTSNMKRQYQAIRKLQNELLQIGVAAGQLEQIKQKALRVVNNRRNNDPQPTKEDEPTVSDEQVQDRTRERYDALLSEVALLQKMHNDHQKQYLQAQDEKQQAIRKNMASRNKLIQCENEIQNLEKEILALKNKVVPSNMKPLRPLRSFSSHQGENLQKLLPAKPKHKGLNHLLKFDQVGIPSAKGQRFTDRTVLGKSNLTSRITGIKVFFERVSGVFGGLQITYEGRKKGGQYVRKDKQAKQKQYNEQEYLCKGNASIRSISGTLTPDDKLQSLHITSSDGNSHRFGTAKTETKQFTFQIGSQQYPVCVFGSLLVIKQLGKKEYSILQHLGFQIQNQSGIQATAFNEFNE